MEAMEAILTRRSTRSYRPDPVEKEKLEKVIEAALAAPSGGNSQNNHFFVIQSRKVIQTLVKMAESAFSQMEADENTYASLRHSIIASKKGGYVFCYDAPVLIMVANQIHYGNNMADCACAIENMCVAANALDLGSCYINQLRWLNEDPQLVSYFHSLGMGEEERIYGGLVLGYPRTSNGLPPRHKMERKGNVVTFIDDL